MQRFFPRLKIQHNQKYMAILNQRPHCNISSFKKGGKKSHTYISGTQLTLENLFYTGNKMTVKFLV